jgi:hypothetical protein
MKKVSLVVSKYLQKNNIFNVNSKDNRDNIFSCFIKLKKEFSKNGYELNTQDIVSIKNADIVIYYNMPSNLPLDSEKDKSYLILSESELIRKDNYDLNRHKYFNKIFTWHDELVDNLTYFKLNFSHHFPSQINKDLMKKDKLCILIAGNKMVDHPLELYSKRVEVIRWFEKNYLEDFDLYGVGWDKYKFKGPKIIRVFNRIPYFSQLFAKFTKQDYLSYKGMVKNKKEVMEKYKFSICYENAQNIPGYITEKIFDSLFAGCVPIYWGANNILDYIPKECFIDKRNFGSYEELYGFIKNMSDYKYIEYLNNIEQYLLSSRKNLFSDEYFSKKIVEVIVKKDKLHDY